MTSRALLVMLVVCLACTVRVVPVGQCEFDDDCASGFVCADLYCRTPCKMDRDCPPSWRCLATDRGTQLTCVAAPVQTPACRRDSDCSDGSACLDGRCRPQCLTDYDCRVVNPYSVCVSQRCELRCPTGRGDCDRNARNGCETDLRTNGNHCGACGRRCALDNAVGVCVAGACAVARCAGGYADCDRNAANGCETLITSISNCGACGRACAFANALAVCSAGISCQVGGCNRMFADCDRIAANGCEVNIDTSLAHCGACGQRCALANAITTCAAGTCEIATCAPGFGDCDERNATGCEVDTRSNVAHCGGCGRPCRPGAVCASGVCLDSCIAPRSMCGAVCVDLQTDPSHCGACGRVCPTTPNTTVRCVAGLCSSVCNAGFGDCNGLASDGCETRLDSVMHCGRCGNTCTATAPSMPMCTASGVCAIGCGEGTYREGGACVAVPAPRLLGPLSGATSSTQRPTFRWINAPISGRAEGARVQLCRDRACSVIVATLDVTGVSATLGTALPPGVYFWRAFGRTDGNVGIAASPVWELVIGAREAPRAAAWGAYADLNGDGFADLVVTESALNRVHVYHGAVGGVPTRPSVTRSDVVAGFAARAVIAGDVNGDGFVDLAVSAPGESAVYVYPGSTTGIATLGLRRTGSAGSRFGAAIAAAGDVNGDGFGDLLVASGDGSVTLLRGSVGGLVLGSDVIRAPVGASGVPRMAGVGKVDDDLFDDVLLAWNEGTPAVLFVRGNAAGLTMSTPVRITANASAVSAAGDVNGDGHADMLLANAATATAWIYTGSATGVNMTPAFTLTDTGSGFASTGASLGDINGDGFSDVVLGNARNTAWVFLGAPRGDLLRTVIPSSLRRFATGVGEVGDLNRDGFSDVVIGAPSDAMGGGPCDGAVLVFDGGRAGVTTSPSTTLRPPDSMSCHTEFGAWVM